MREDVSCDLPLLYTVIIFFRLDSEVISPRSLHVSCSNKNGIAWATSDEVLLGGPRRRRQRGAKAARAKELGSSSTLFGGSSLAIPVDSGGLEQQQMIRSDQIFLI